MNWAELRKRGTRMSEANSRAGNEESIGFLEAVSIGVGGMVGGGIFAVLGLAVEIGGGGTFVAFLIAGIVALLTTYSYAQLSVALPSEGGTVTFLNEGFGAGTLSGSLNVLLWFAYVITTSLYAFAFGSYGATLLPESSESVARYALTTGAIVVIAALNVLSAKLIAAAEDYVVAAKIFILVGFVVVALTQADLSASAPSEWESTTSLIAGGMLIFVAYEGFELIANSAADVRNPERSVPRALYTSVLFTIVLYMLVAVSTVGLLTAQQITDAADFALAAAADQIWSGAGFTVIVIAAILSTASAINATLYGTARLSVVIAIDGEAPSALEKKIAGKPLLGLFITAGLALLVANFVPLASISSLASAAFLIIFAAVNVANARLADRTASRKSVSLLGAAACIGALSALIAHIASESPSDLILMAGLLLVTFLGEASYQKRKEIRERYCLDTADL